MADNVSLNSGSGGETLATDDIGGIQYQRVKIARGADGSYDGDLSVATPMPILDALAIARGVESNFELWRMLGRNTDIDAAAAEDIIVGGGTHVQPTTARTHDIVSGSANDTNSAGSGARTVLVEGLATGGTEQSETVALNGTTPVATANTYIAINRLTVSTAGSTGSNEGLITATAQSDLTVSTSIAIGRNRSEDAVYRVPGSKTAYVVGWSVSIGEALTTGAATATLWEKPIGQVWVPIATRGVIAGGFHEPIQAPTVIAADSEIKVSASVDADNTEVIANVDLVIVS